MLSLIYVSVASPGLTMAAMEDLAKRAGEANAANALTGILAYNSNRFMQLLEGTGDAVLETMQRIERDERHSDITFIRQSTRESRECPDWTMRPIVTPLNGVGSADIFMHSLPASMDVDTRVLFTSFASTIDAIQAERLLDREERLMAGRMASND